MAEFLCCESSQTDRTVRSQTDPVLVDDNRVLDNLLAMEDQRVPSCSYFKCVQTEIQPHMRKVVASWMLEVCEEQRCEDCVFPIAMNYFDRFLSITDIRKLHLQLLGAVCLLTASKFRQTKAISVETLIYYTDYSVTREEIMNWELLVLGKLKWDISAVVANDFVDHLMVRLAIEGKQAVTVRKHASVFISLCATEHHFLSFNPSIIASASVAVAAQGLTWLRKKWRTPAELLALLQGITHIQAEFIQICIDQIEELVTSNMNCMERDQDDSMSGDRHQSNNSTHSGKNVQQEHMDSPNKPETPTDVQDVLF